MNIDFRIHLIKILYKNKFVLNLACLYFTKKLNQIISFHRKKYLFKSYYGSVSKHRAKINSFYNDRFRFTVSFQFAESIIDSILRLHLSFLKVLTCVMKVSPRTLNYSFLKYLIYLNYYLIEHIL